MKNSMTRVAQKSTQRETYDKGGLVAVSAIKAHAIRQLRHNLDRMNLTGIVERRRWHLNIFDNTLYVLSKKMMKLLSKIHRPKELPQAGIWEPLGV